MTWDDFQSRARRVIPAQELKPKRCWIGVLSHEKIPGDSFEELDFVWMIGHHKVSIQKIHDTYQKRQEGLEFQLLHKDTFADRNDTIKSYMALGDDLVLFVASTVPLLRTPALTSTPAHAPAQISNHFPAHVPAQFNYPMTAQLRSDRDVRKRPSSLAFDGSSESPSQATHVKSEPLEDTRLPDYDT
ncbi:hypothetical protein BKA63DRAFT_576247 [Paraphoma chrysanthemicola]|nr:hypothetical protein BKA63DRAFT_576247 [Paraphoma chrysanthemicola]